MLYFSLPLHAATTSLSDLVIEPQQDQKQAGDLRNPFTTGTSENNADATSLSLEGTIVGPDTKLGIVSGRVLNVGQMFGAFVVKDILPGTVVVQSVEGESRLTIEGAKAIAGSADNSFELAFSNADLKQTLRALASAGRFNIIIPETVAGSVSLIFHQTPLRDALSSILHVNNLEFAQENKIVRVGKAEDFEKGAFFSTKTISLKYALANDILETVKSHLTEKGTVTQDVRTNSIIVKDTDAVIQNIEDIVAKLDRQDTQVHIEAKIVDVTRSFSRSMGIQWGITRDTGRVTGFGGPTVGSIALGSGDPLNVNLSATVPTSGVGFIIGNIAKGANLEAQITMAEQKGDAHIISQPSVTTVNNVAAKIRSGVKIYVKTTSTIAIGGSSGSTSASDTGLQVIDTGITLTVTPQITSVDTVKLKIDAQESEADFSKTVDGIPSVIDNTATTTVLVRDGETTVIGGLMKVKKSNTTSGVPGLSSIPVFGWLFKSKTKAKSDNELLIFITPRIVAQLAEAPLPPSQAALAEAAYIEANQKKGADKKQHVSPSPAPAKTKGRKSSVRSMNKYLRK